MRGAVGHRAHPAHRATLPPVLEIFQMLRFTVLSPLDLCTQSLPSPHTSDSTSFTLQISTEAAPPPVSWALSPQG